MAAKQKFPLNVTCKTSHGLAFGAVGKQYNHKLCANLRLTDIARAIDSQNWELVRSVQDTLNNYLASADEKIGLVHCPAEKLKNERMRRAASNVVEATGRLWAKICDLNNHATPIHHDGYLKLWTLSKPDLTQEFVDRRDGRKPDTPLAFQKKASAAA